MTEDVLKQGLLRAGTRPYKRAAGSRVKRRGAGIRKRALACIAAASLAAVSCAGAPAVPDAARAAEGGDSLTIADAVYDGYLNVKGSIPAKRRIAVLGITGANADEAEWVSDELTHLLVNAKRHTVIDRRGLNVTLAEKKPSGEIEEASAMDIGYLLGAEVVLYGNISRHQNRICFLSLKAMNVRNGEIIAITSERFTAT